MYKDSVLSDAQSQSAVRLSYPRTPIHLKGLRIGPSVRYRTQGRRLSRRIARQCGYRFAAEGVSRRGLPLNCGWAAMTG